MRAGFTAVTVTARPGDAGCGPLALADAGGLRLGGAGRGPSRKAGPCQPQWRIYGVSFTVLVARAVRRSVCGPPLLDRKSPAAILKGQKGLRQGRKIK